MRRAVLAVLLGFAVPGLLVPGGLELRLCFCGGSERGCCHAPVAAEPDHESCCHAQEGEDDVTAKADSRCHGCVMLSVPATRAIRVPPTPGPTAATAAAPAMPEPPRLRPIAFEAAIPPRWHPPPGQRTLPLVI
jgi:hypothetical protein